MREFAQRGSALRRLDRGGKIVYTAFLSFLLLGLLSAALLHADSMGARAATAAAYWNGDEAGMVYPKSPRQILELTHFHLFTEPLIWLVVAHLYHMGRGRALISLGTLLSMGAQIALPYLITQASPAFSLLSLPATAGLLLGLCWMIAASLKELWWSPSSP